MIVNEPVTGYRALEPERVALMNRIKALGNELGSLVTELRALPPTQPGQPPELVRHVAHEAMVPTIDQRAVSIGCTELQTGLMWLNRAVAQPSTFA